MKYVLLYAIITNGDSMEKYLITLDLDGTLLNNSSKISQETKAYIKKLKENGHKILIATGRPYRGAKPIYDELELDTPIIFHNGAGINRGNSDGFNSFEKTIPKLLLDDLFSYSKDNIVTAFYSIENELYVYNYLKEVEFLFFLNAETKVFEGPLNNPKHKETSNVIIAVNLEYMEKFESYIKNTLTKLDFRYWYKDEKLAIYEVFLKGYNKGTALNIISDFYKIPNDKTISFGDGNNDIELLKASGHGVKMVNGTDKLDSVKDAITSHTNDEDGVIKYLQKFIK